MSALPPEPQPTFYVTTPIYYVNARPHIGHAYTTIAADVLARRHRLLGHDTFFLTGTDEHGQKIERSARAAGIDPQTFADQVAASFRSLWDSMGITYTDFIRTTEPRHKERVQHLFRELQSRGAIYKSTYTGQYCVHDEAYVDGPPGIRCPDCGRVTETVSEANYYFRLSAFQQPLLDLIEPGPNGEPSRLQIQPDSRRNEVLSFIRGGLKDLSISRTSFTWGIPVPDDPDHVIYVWLDALANYMTAIGYGSDLPADRQLFEKFWPADLHLVGKEIIRFHCVYWPAFLLALNPDLQFPDAVILNNAKDPCSSSEATHTRVLPSSAQHIRDEGGEAQASSLIPSDTRAWSKQWLPKAVTAHGWLLFEESKMSKSRGNIVRTETILDAFGDHYRRSLADYNAQQLKKDPAFQPAPEPTKAEADLFASDVLRYFLLREIPFGQDGSFSFDALIERYNADLANGYGNLVSRTLNLILKTSAGTIEDCLEANSLVFYQPPLIETHNHPAQDEILSASECQALAMRLLEIAGGAGAEIERSAFAESLSAIHSAIGLVDQLMTSRKPWAATNTDISQKGRRSTLYTAAESIRIITALLYPILPYTAAKVWAQLGLGSIEDAAARGDLRNLQWGGLQPGTKLGPLAPLFPRAPKELAQTMIDKESSTPRTPALGSKTPDDLTSVTAQNDAAASGTTEFAEAPLSSVAESSQDQAASRNPLPSPRRETPAPSRFSNETISSIPPDPTDRFSPGAPPRTSAFSSANPIAEVGGTVALDPTFEKTPSHSKAPASGLFASPASATPVTATATETTPFAPQITIDDFAKVDLRVAKVVAAERIPKADKLLRLEVELGPAEHPQRRQILSGIAQWYTPEELIGRRIIVIANLAPRTMRGLESHGMLLAASHGENGKPILATFADSDDIPPGARLK